MQYMTAMDYLGYQDSTIPKLYPSAEHRNLDTAPQNYRDYYQQIKKYIRDNVSMQITRQSVSEHIHISPDYISHIVRTIAECSMQGADYPGEDAVCPHAYPGHLQVHR